MQQITPYSLWLGHIGDVNRPEQISQAGIQALVDLADNEKPTLVFRDLVYCRIPIVDGAGNAEWLLRLAVETVAALLRANVSTLVFCSAGLSRSPSIAAASISSVEGKPLAFGLARLRGAGSFDISPALWSNLEAIFDDHRPPRLDAGDTR